MVYLDVMKHLHPKLFIQLESMKKKVQKCGGNDFIPLST